MEKKRPSHWDCTHVALGIVKPDGYSTCSIPLKMISHVPVGNRVRILVEDIGKPDAKTIGQCAFEACATGESWARLSDFQRAQWEKTGRAAAEWAKRNEETKKEVDEGEW